MIKNEDLAKKLSVTLVDIYTRLEDTVRVVSDAGSEEELRGYRIAITTVLASLIFDVMEPLYELHPDLAPEDWNS